MRQKCVQMEHNIASLLKKKKIDNIWDIFVDSEAVFGPTIALPIVVCHVWHLVAVGTLFLVVGAAEEGHVAAGAAQHWRDAADGTHGT